MLRNLLVLGMCAATALAKSKPEKIQLKDILASVMSSTGKDSGDAGESVSMIRSEKPIIDWDESDRSTPSINGGIVTTLTSSFFESYNNIVIDIFEASIKNIEIKDFCSEQDMGTVMTSHLCVANQNVIAYSVDKDRSSIQIDAEKNALKMHTSGINLDFAFDYKVWSEPEWIDDEGKGSFKIKDCALDIVLSLTSVNGILQVDFSQVNIFLPEFNTTLDGTSDFSRAMEIIFRNFKHFMQKELSNILAWRLAKSVESTLNEVMTQGSKEGAIDLGAQDNANYWNMTLLEDPIFTKDYVSFVMDGSMTPGNLMLKKDQQKQMVKEDFPRMPLYVGESSDPVKLQLFISEMTLNKMMSTMFENRSLVKGGRISSTYIKTFIPNFEEVFGKKSDVFVLMEASKAPQIQIASDFSTLETDVFMRVLNPFNDEFEAFYMKYTIKAVLEFELLEDFTLIANIKEAKIDVTEFETYFKTRVTIKEMNTKVKTLSQPAIKMFNTLLSIGRGLPIPSEIETELAQTRMFTYDHFLMIESDPRFEQRVSEKVLSITEHMQTEFRRYMEKIN